MQATIQAVQAYELHGTRYFQLRYVLDGEERPREARLSHDMAYPDPQAGDRVDVRVREEGLVAPVGTRDAHLVGCGSGGVRVARGDRHDVAATNAEDAAEGGGVEALTTAAEHGEEGEAEGEAAEESAESGESSDEES